MTPDTLPASVSTFVGRQRELDELRARLAQARLVTLTGVGGVGKTRLALELARSWSAQGSSDVVLVELAPLAEPAFVLPAIAAAVGSREQPHRPLLDTLADVLRARQRVLLVLDNCEHVVAAAAAIADQLLRRCGELRILATGREPLGITGELVWRVPRLSLPPTSWVPTAARLEESEAARLFLARAQATDRDFRPGDRDAAAIAEVCRRLDGIPLALELAAAQVGVLGVQQLARRLDDRFGLLTSGSRTAPARQQTLRAALTWSYDLLTAPEQRLFEQLAVFVGGWTLEAAEQVCAGHGLAAEQVLDTLVQLASKSLVLPGQTPEGAMRYQFLETVRHYAGERLRARAEAEALPQRHADYFLQVAEQVAPRVLEGDEGLEALEQEHDNLRAALRWLIDHQATDQAQRLGAAVGRLWFFRGHLSEGRAWLAELLAMPAGDAPTPARAELLYRIGMLAWVQGDAARARPPLLEALAVAQHLGDLRAEAQALFALGHLARTAGEHAAARKCYGQSVAVARQAGLRRHETIALLGLGWVAHDTGDAALATSTLDEVLGIARAHGWSTLALQALVIQADVRRQKGDAAAARSMAEEALRLGRQVGARWWIGSASLALAHALAWQGDRARAGELAREGLMEAYELGDQPGTARALEVFAQLAVGQPERSLRLAGAAARLRAFAGPPLAPRDREQLERYVATARRMLGPSRAAAAWSAGQALSLEDAVACALEVSPEPATAQAPHRPGGLTAREREIAALIARGFSNRGIADELVISESTVVRHVSNILGKLRVSARAEVAVWAVREGLDNERHD